MTTLTRRVIIDNSAKAAIQVITWAAIALFVAILLTLAGKSLPVLGEHSLADLLFSGTWDPEAGSFGFLPAIVGTLLVMLVSMTLAVPVAILASRKTTARR